MDKIYRPTDREPFMNAMQQEYFRQKLLKWKNELIEESNQTLQNMQEESLAQPDLAAFCAGRASTAAGAALLMRGMPAAPCNDGSPRAVLERAAVRARASPRAAREYAPRYVRFSL